MWPVEPSLGWKIVDVILGTAIAALVVANVIAFWPWRGSR